jgi:hypothetical protein
MGSSATDDHGEEDDDDEDDVDYEEVDRSVITAEAKKKQRYKYLPKHLREKHLERPLYSTQMAAHAQHLKPLRPLQEGVQSRPVAASALMNALYKRCT